MAQKASLIGQIKKFLSGSKDTWPDTPPGPNPPNPAGPFSDPIHMQFPVHFLNRELLCKVYYRYDPACDLHAEIEEFDFSFKTRAHSLQFALQHLDQAFASRRLAANIAGLANGARWENDHHNCEAVFLPNVDRLHHAFEQI